MAKKNVLTGIVMALLAFAIVISGCDNGNSDGGDDSPVAKSITITGIVSSDNTKAIGIMLYSVFDPEANEDAIGMGTVSGGSVTSALLNTDLSAWTGSGSYYILLAIDPEGTPRNYVYTNGEAGPISESAASSMAQKYSITSATSTIAFSTFTQVTE